jgi:putative ABC transport system substrate-binding protein
LFTTTLRSQVPSVFGGCEHVAANGSMSYLSSNGWHWARAASFVDKVLKGTKPADIPVQQPTKFELMIDVKTAKACGIAIPQSLLQCAQERAGRWRGRSPRVSRAMIL